MVDRIACSCVTCPKCGSWVVVRQQTEGGANKKKFRESCPAPECAKEFEFETDETRRLEVPFPPFERRLFYRSELSCLRRADSRLFITCFAGFPRSFSIQFLLL